MQTSFLPMGQTLLSFTLAPLPLEGCLSIYTGLTESRGLTNCLLLEPAGGREEESVGILSHPTSSQQGWKGFTPPAEMAAGSEHKSGSYPGIHTDQQEARVLCKGPPTTHTHSAHAP